MWAARSNQYESIKIIMKYGGDLNISTENGNAMHQACAEDHIETVEFLLEQEINLNIQDKNGDSPLHVCAVNGSSNSFVAILNNFLKKIEELEDGIKKTEIEEAFKTLLNL